ncbi:XdhC Rossmann domain [Carpediemonas membranifera]|uniref:XdhC Rossmann domain n=1 Tax=Carpediemonas membranifera TaxID=201153 RepID=A0A8J6B492_9EUKA|nr:XdhC Rossmann domain [Carpediemonas membranifera]|eukprot:KAG9389712.1 XdhC Rossmann domain [Carpediemonas membranifera]
MAGTSASFETPTDDKKVVLGTPLDMALSCILHQSHQRQCILVSPILGTGQLPTPQISRMAVYLDDTQKPCFVGTVGGGNMEGQCRDHAVCMLRTPSMPSVASIAFTVHDDCSNDFIGSTRFLFERADSHDDALEAIMAIRSRPFTVGVEIVKVGPYSDPTARCQRMVLAVDPRTDKLESISGCVDTDDETRASLQARALALSRGVHMELTTLRTDPAEWFLYTIAPRPSLFVFGAGHVGQEVVYSMARSGFVIHIIDDRQDIMDAADLPTNTIKHVVSFDPASPVPFFGTKTLELEASDPVRAFVVIMSRGHSADVDILHHISTHMTPRYVGMMASKGKAARAVEKLRSRGVGQEWIDSIKCPIGLPLGGDTPGEIAISIAAQLVLEWRGGRKHFADQGALYDVIHG